jgi:GNAT superfamily N-acetyltransferase
MARIQPIDALNGSVEALLRARAQHSGRDADRFLQQFADGLAGGKINAAVASDSGGRARGIVAWRWFDRGQTYAQVVLTYAGPETPPQVGADLVEHVFGAVSGTPTLEVIEARLRDESPGMRPAWQQHGFAIFERCRLVRDLGHIPLPIHAPPDGYVIAPWGAPHQGPVEQLAVMAQRDTIDAAAVPDASGKRLVSLLRRLPADQYGGVDAWNPQASLVAILNGSGFVASLGVHPQHRRRGLARVLMVRCLNACHQQRLPSVAMPVTDGNPVTDLCRELGFRRTECGEVAVWWRDDRQQAWLTP